MDQQVSLNRREGAPALHRQLTRVLQERIRSCEFGPGERLPSEHTLAASYDVSRALVRQALHQLVAQGEVQARHGSGYFVNRRRLRRDLPSLTSFTMSMSKLGSVRTHIIQCDLEAAPHELSEQLPQAQRRRGLRVVHVRRVGYLDDEPVTLLRGYYPYPFAQALVGRDLTNQSIYALLREETGSVPDRAETLLSVSFASPEHARLLDVAEGSALFSLDSSTWSGDGLLMEVSHGLYRSDRFEFFLEKR